MPFPNIIPTGRQYDSGDYPVKSFRSQSGVETRILYGDTRTGMQLKLSFDNIADSLADSFLTHFEEVRGTFSTFTLPANTLVGWSGSSGSLDAATANKWRYEGPPQITNNRPGVSSVQVNLLGVL